MSKPSPIVPALRYRDAPAAIEFLCAVLGFEKQLVVAEDERTVTHAQLVHGSGMIMLGSAVDSEYGRLIAQPDEGDGRVTQSVYLVDPDAGAAHDRAVAAGWRILIPLQTEEYGGPGFTCADPEGHVWTVGAYDPWAGR